MSNDCSAAGKMISRYGLDSRDAAVAELAVTFTARPAKIFARLAEILLPEIRKSALDLMKRESIEIAAINLTDC